MPIHDWTRVEPGIFHAFHVSWITELQGALNGGLLPPGYYALAEQHAGRIIPDLLTLEMTSPQPRQPDFPSGGTLVADAPPKAQRRHTIDASSISRQRSLAIRHVSEHRLVALIEIVSPANKDRPSHVAAIAKKAVDALDAGIHVLFVDLFPPGRHDPHGLHGAIHERLDDSAAADDVTADRPLTIVSYAAGPRIEVYLHLASVGETLPEAPLFLESDRYVNAPLESTYRTAYAKQPEFWRHVVEGI